MTRLSKEQVIEKYGPIEGEKRWANIVYTRKWYLEHKEKHNETTKQYRLNHPGYRKLEYRRRRERNPNEGKIRYSKNKEKEKERNKKYYQAHKQDILEYSKNYHKKHPEVHYKASKKYRENNRDKINAKYKSDKQTRADRLVRAYIANDLKLGIGECTITKQWMIDNIFSGQVCYWCGESDWTKLGCDRIDNTQPHTPDNVVCCCGKCNVKKSRTSFHIYKMLKTPTSIEIKY